MYKKIRNIFVQAVFAVVLVVFATSHAMPQYVTNVQRPESQRLLTKTVSRTNELIDGLPPMTETAAQMADLWAIAYPQLSGLLTKAGKWADKVAVPA